MTDPLRLSAYRRLFGILAFVIAGGILFATLWPFNFVHPNHVTWLLDEPGLRFQSGGIALSSSPLVVPPAAASPSSCSFEVLVVPRRAHTEGAILAIYHPGTLSEFEIFQEGSGIALQRHFLRGRPPVRSPIYGTDGYLRPGELTLATVTTSSDGVIVYRNGAEASSFPRFDLACSDFEGPVALGSLWLMSNPFVGEIRGLAFYNRGLTPAEVASDSQRWMSGRPPGAADLAGPRALYTFTEGSGTKIHGSGADAPDLNIPSAFLVPHKPFLESPSMEFIPALGYLRDIIENIVGFIPLGLFLCLWLAGSQRLGRAFLYSALAGSGLSLAIEIAQFYVPSRGSGITDVITNTTGAAVGAVAAVIYARRFGRRNSPQE